MPVHDQLLGSTQPVLSISLEPGESVIAGSGQFAWMTDSIQMTAGPAGMSAYAATAEAGTVAFAARLPGVIEQVEVQPGQEYLVHREAFVAGTPAIEITTGLKQPLGPATPADEFILLRISGHGHAWVELSGDVVRRELAAGTSLRTYPWHIGMADASVTVQMAELADDSGSEARADARHLAVLSGPGAVWLQSTAGLGAQNRPSATNPARTGPAAEGAAGPAAR